jgi:hypothetical protein
VDPKVPLVAVVALGFLASGIVNVSGFPFISVTGSGI